MNIALTRLHALTVLGAAFLLAAATPADAQQVVHRMEGRFNVGALSVRDDLLVPYAFTGPAFALATSYGFSVNQHALDLTLDVGSSPLWTRAGDEGLHIHGELGAAYTVKLLTNAQRALWVGAMTRFSHELAYLYSWDDAHGYWLDALMLGPALRHAERLWAATVLELRADLGLLGIASRPPARRLNKQDALSKGDYHFNRLAQDPSFAWFGDQTLLRAEALLRWRRAPDRFGNGFGAGVETRFARARHPEPYTSWYGGLVLAYGWSWP